MNFKALRAFTLVVELGSITDAATKLGISASGVSRLISQLEAETDLKLFNRMRRGLTPTEAGLLLFKEAHRILADLDALPSVLEKIRRGAFQRLNIVATPRLVPGLVLPTLAAFARCMPTVECVLDVQPKWDLERSLATNRYDVGLAVLPVASTTMDQRPLYRIMSEILMPTSHPLAARREVTARDLADERFIGFLPGQLFRRQLMEIAQPEEREFDLAIETSNAWVAAELVGRGCGLTLGDRLIVSGARLEGVTARPVSPPVWTTIGLLTSREETTNPHAAAFVDSLRDTLQAFAKSGDNGMIIELAPH